jgi:O-antigen/teichoic acid export membrane protein
LKLISTRSAWAFADQGVVSLGNFLTSLLLARQLRIAEYGTYVLILSSILIANSLHYALVTLPLVIKASSLSGSEQRKYATGSAWLTGVSSFLTIAIVMVSAVSLGRPRVVVIACLAAVAWQLQETMRRTLIAQLRYSTVIWGDTVSYLGQATILFAVAHARLLSIEFAFLAMAATSLLAALIQAIQVRLTSLSFSGLVSNAREFWTLARWLLPAALIGPLTSQAYPWILTWTHGRDHAANFQALINVLGVTHPLLLSVSALVIPAVAAAKGTSRCSNARRLAWSYTWQFEALVAPYLIILLIWPGAVLRLYYGASSPFLSLLTPLRLMAVTYFFAFPMTVWAAALCGVERVRAGFRVQVLGATTTAVIGVPACMLFGVSGAASVDAISRAVRAIVSYVELAPEREPPPKNGVTSDGNYPMEELR